MQLSRIYHNNKFKISGACQQPRKRNTKLSLEASTFPKCYHKFKISYS